MPAATASGVTAAAVAGCGPNSGVLDSTKTQSKYVISLLGCQFVHGFRRQTAGRGRGQGGRQNGMERKGREKRRTRWGLGK